MKLVPPHSEVLWTPAPRMTNEDRVMHQLTFKAMGELVLEQRAAGIAFPQVGIPLAAFVTRYPDFPVCVNPSWKPVGQNFSSRLEGSISYRGFHYYVRRPERVYAIWDDIDGFQKTKLMDGNEARVFQNLWDMLQGKQVFPRPKPPKEQHVSATPNP